MVQSLIVEYSVRLCDAVTDCRIQFQTVWSSQIVRYSVRPMQSLIVMQSLIAGYSVRLCDAVSDCRIQFQSVGCSHRLYDTVSD